jgi:hypothetical protein
MADNKKSEFVVTDKRRFNAEGESSGTQPEPAPEEQPREIAPPSPSAASQEPQEQEREVPPPPTAEQQKEQHDAFKASTKQLDDALASKMGPGRSAKDFEVTFERFAASLYMSALVQLGLVHEQGAQPQVDLIGARQSIDTLGMIAEKTKGNLTPPEDNLIHNCLYELRMAYVDVTNMLTRGPQPGQGGPGVIGGPGGPIPFPGKK